MDVLCYVTESLMMSYYLIVLRQFSLKIASAQIFEAKPVNRGDQHANRGSP